MSLGALLTAALAGVPAAAAVPSETPAVAGTVTSVAGTATVERAGASVALTRGSRLFSGDLLRTGPDGRLGAILRDDTALSMGPDSELAIDEFVFSPAGGRLAMLLRLIQGTLGYLSGKIAKLAPGAARLETPVATIGVRGTRLAIHARAAEGG